MFHGTFRIPSNLLSVQDLSLLGSYSYTIKTSWMSRRCPNLGFSGLFDAPIFAPYCFWFPAYDKIFLRSTSDLSVREAQERSSSDCPIQTKVHEAQTHLESIHRLDYDKDVFTCIQTRRMASVMSMELTFISGNTVRFMSARFFY